VNDDGNRREQKEIEKEESWTREKEEEDKGESRKI
jgi:hypothetical protein